jgi:hypothetical protein
MLTIGSVILFFWIKHAPVYVRDHNHKKVKTRAIGLGGIVYEIHGPALEKAGIIECKSDLYNPIKNVKSAYHIYLQYLKMPIVKISQNKYESAMLRYYGLNNRKTYSKLIQNKWGELVESEMFLVEENRRNTK